MNVSSGQFGVAYCALLCAAFVYLVVYFIFCSLAAFCHANFTIKLNRIELTFRVKLYSLQIVLSFSVDYLTATSLFAILMPHTFNATLDNG